MTNPSNSVGTNAAYAGRTSANAFNDDLAPYSRGVLSGWGCTPSSGLTVALGGDGSTRDVAVAEDNAGNKTTINNISGAPVEVTLSAAPGANSRIDAIVAYVDNPPQGSATIADNYEACGLIPVSGTAAASPTAPTDSQIRSAITADGASGTTAYYVVLATVTIPSGTTDITSDNIANGGYAMLSSQNVDFTSFVQPEVIIEQSASLSFTAQGPGILLIMGTLSNVWGYGGGSFRIGITKTSGTQSIASSASEVSSEGNTIGRSVGAKASVVFTAAGQTITVGISKIDGVSVQNNNAPSIVGIFLPAQA